MSASSSAEEAQVYIVDGTERDDVKSCIMIIFIIFGFGSCAVALKSGRCGIEAIGCFLLYFLFWIPGVIYAWWYCFCRD